MPQSVQGRITVLIADDHPLLREGVAAILVHEPDIVLVAEAATGREAIDLFRAHRPDVTLMDLQMPGVKGDEAIKSIRRDFPDARILVVTTYEGDVRALRAMRAGACGYLLKNKLRKDLPNAIRSAYTGRACIPDEIARAIAEHSADDQLTLREVEILAHVADGNANKEIAAKLSIAEETVKTHMGNILSKLAAKDRTHAVMIGIRRGIIDS
jgi:DNA-binding NarL/FixJ family response regulator